MELCPRLLPIVGHVLKESSLKVNLKRALRKAIEAKKGGAVTPKKDPPRKSNGGTPGKKEEAAKKRGQLREKAAEQQAAAAADSPSPQQDGSRLGPQEEDGAQPADAQSAQRVAEAKRALEALISERTAAARDEDAAPSGSGSQERGEAGFEWDHPTENALLAVSRVSREGAGEQNGQVARQLYRDLAQLWPPGIMVRPATVHNPSRADPAKEGDWLVRSKGAFISVECPSVRAQHSGGSAFRVGHLVLLVAGVGSVCCHPFPGTVSLLTHCGCLAACRTWRVCRRPSGVPRRAQTGRPGAATMGAEPAPRSRNRRRGRKDRRRRKRKSWRRKGGKAAKRKTKGAGPARMEQGGCWGAKQRREWGTTSRGVWRGPKLRIPCLASSSSFR